MKRPEIIAALKAGGYICIGGLNERPRPWASTGPHSSTLAGHISKRQAERLVRDGLLKLNDARHKWIWSGKEAQ